MIEKYFGTDGIRGRVGEKLTAALCFKLGYASGRKLKNATLAPVVMGHDGRQSHHSLMHAFVAGLSSAGVACDLVGLLPTPAIAYLTVSRKAQFGVMISASHNPACDNGIKFFNADGYKFDDRLELEIEAMLYEPVQTFDNASCAIVHSDEKASEVYQQFCLTQVPNAFKTNLKIVLDCANGAASRCAPALFKAWGADVVSLACEPDGSNINDACGATAPEKLQQAVLEYQADCGLAFDGDADRMIAVDETGAIVDGDEILYCLVMAAKQAGKTVPGVVGTQMTNFGFEQAMRAEQIAFERAKVGDKYVLEKLRENNWQLGGESSGHLINLDYTTTGDGPMAGLQLLAAMQASGKPLSQLKQGMQKVPQVLINVPIKPSFELHRVDIQAAVKQAETQLADQGRVLLRLSGTEPLCRVMVEGQSLEHIQTIAEQLAMVIR